MENLGSRAFENAEQWKSADLEERTKRILQLLKRTESSTDEISRILAIEVKHKQTVLPVLVENITELLRSSNPGKPEGAASMLGCFTVISQICRVTMECDNDIQIQATNISHSIRNKLLTVVIWGIRKKNMPKKIRAAAYLSLVLLLSLAQANFARDSEREVIMRVILAGLKDGNVQVLNSCLRCAVALARNAHSRLKLPPYLVVANPAGKPTPGPLAAAVTACISHEDEAVTENAMLFWNELLRIDSAVFEKIFKSPVSYHKIIVPVVIQRLQRCAKKAMNVKVNPENPNKVDLVAQELLKRIFKALFLTEAKKSIMPFIQKVFSNSAADPNVSATISETYVALSVVSAFAKAFTRIPIEKEIPASVLKIISVLQKMAEQELLEKKCIETLTWYLCHQLSEASCTGIFRAFNQVFDSLAARSKAASGRIKVAILTYFSEILQGMQSDPTSEDDMLFPGKSLDHLADFFSGFFMQVMTPYARDKDMIGLEVRHTAANVIGDYFSCLQELRRDKALLTLPRYIEYSVNTLPSIAAAASDKDISLQIHHCVCILQTNVLLAANHLEVSVAIPTLQTYATTIATRATDICMAGDDEDPDLAISAATVASALQTLCSLSFAASVTSIKAQAVCLKILSVRSANEVMLQQAIALMTSNGLPVSDAVPALLGIFASADLATILFPGNEHKFTTVRESLRSLTDLLLVAEPAALSSHILSIVCGLRTLQNQIERVVTLFTCKKYSLSKSHGHTLHLKGVLQICNDLAVTYSAILSVPVPSISGTGNLAEAAQATMLACRLLDIVGTLVQRVQLQTDATTFRQAEQLLVMAGNLACDVLHRAGLQKISMETRPGAIFILNTLNATPTLQSQIQVQQALEFSRTLCQKP